MEDLETSSDTDNQGKAEATYSKYFLQFIVESVNMLYLRKGINRIEDYKIFE